MLMSDTRSDLFMEFHSYSPFPTGSANRLMKSLKRSIPEI